MFQHSTGNAISYRANIDVLNDIGVLIVTTMNLSIFLYSGATTRGVLTGGSDTGVETGG